jgi:hypothetical protein
MMSRKFQIWKKKEREAGEDYTIFVIRNNYLQLFGLGDSPFLGDTDFENQALFMQTLFGWIFILCAYIWNLFLPYWNMK